MYLFFFFFSSRRRHTRYWRDWSSDVCSSDLPDSLVSDLSPSDRQIVEILKALSREPRVMILDEATASLGARQVGRLFELVGEGKARGIDRKSTRLNSSHPKLPYAVFCFQHKKRKICYGHCT